MNKWKWLSYLKVLVIFLLTIGILFLIMIHWKSDAVVKRAVTLIQSRLEDSIRYDHISLEWFRHFPSASLQMTGLHIGDEKDPLITGGNVDVVLRLFPLLKEQVIINKLHIADSRITVTKKNQRWSYEIFKRDDVANKVQKADLSAGSSGWEALVQKIEFENTLIHYLNPDGIKFSLHVRDGVVEGNLTKKLIDARLDLDGEVSELSTGSFLQAIPFPFELNGQYKYDATKDNQELKKWKIENENITLEANGNILNEAGKQWIDLEMAWLDADPQFIKSILPSQNISNWNEYRFAGESSGEVSIKGISSKEESPHIELSTELKKGSIKFPGEGGQLKNILLNIAYDNGGSKSGKASYIRASLRNGSFQGKPLKGEMRMDNLDHPVVGMSVNGSLPAGILNLVLDSSSWNFKEGVFDIDNYQLRGLNLKTVSARSFIQNSIVSTSAKDLRFIYSGNEIKVEDAIVKLDDSGEMKLTATEIFWNKAKGEKVKADLHFLGDKVDFNFNGIHSKGDVAVNGVLTGLGINPVLNADWKVKGIEMKELLASFDNFDQDFITAENLNGKADLWTHTTLPYDLNGNIKSKNITVRAAIEIKDGVLKDLKTLEDFSQYIHLDDLQEIRFNAFRNYLKIENGKVYLPVVFIQSSAVNMSVNGVHSFDQEILYNMKINAGQAAANKLKKADPFKRFKMARKNGWINLYSVLSGTVDNVKYQQDQKQVISSFEQSREMKENLRNYLVERFGHDVYWLEPNEWEDIPEYK